MGEVDMMMVFLGFVAVSLLIGIFFLMQAFSGKAELENYLKEFHREQWDDIFGGNVAGDPLKWMVYVMKAASEPDEKIKVLKEKVRVRFIVAGMSLSSSISFMGIVIIIKLFI